MTLQIRCNNVPRDLLGWYDLLPKEQAYFDWLTPEADGFFRYHGDCYHLGQFEKLPEGAMPGWHGSMATSMTTGLAVMLIEDRVLVASWCS